MLLSVCSGIIDCWRYPYMAMVLNFSQSWALYCLVQFYTITKDELAHIKPLAKFLTFKSIVFLTWWQGLAISLFYTLGLFKSPIAQALQFKSSVQDFIICIEMGIASLVHLYVFPAKPYELMGDLFPGNISVLGDYASTDCSLDPDEVRDSKRPTKLRLPQPDIDVMSGMTIRESVRDVFIGGGEYDVTVHEYPVDEVQHSDNHGNEGYNLQKLKRSLASILGFILLIFAIVSVTTLIFTIVGVIASLSARICFNKGLSANLWRTLHKLEHQ